MKVYITKYALAAGIEEAEAQDCGSGMVKARLGRYENYFRRNEWHTDREAALARAEEMRVAKIASLKKQLAKMEAMRFDA